MSDRTIPAIKKFRIILADSDRDTRRVYHTFLASAGFEVIEVSDGLALLRASFNEQPDLIIADSAISSINGYEACRILKRDNVVGSIPVMLLNSVSVNAVQGGIDVGADYYLSKDFNFSFLSSLIQDIAASARQGNCPAVRNHVYNDSEILLKINSILEQRLMESTVFNKIMQCTNTIGDYEETLSQLFSVLSNVFLYSMMGIFIYDENTVFIDKDKCLENDFVHWVLHSVHQECEFEYDSVETVYLFHEEEQPQCSMWDVNTSIKVLKLYAKQVYIGAIIISRINPNMFEPYEEELLDSILTPLVTVLDNTRMYTKIARTNSDLKTTQEQLAESCRKLDNKVEDRTLLLRKLHEATRLVTTIHEPNRLLATIVDVIINSIGTEVGLVILLDKGKVSTKIEFGLNLKFLKNLRFKDKSRTPFIRRIVQDGDMIIMNNKEIADQLDTKFLKSRNLSLNSLAAVPFKSGTQITGFVVILNKLNNEAFTKEDIVTLSTLSSMASVAIENATLYKHTISKTKLETDIMMAMEIQTELLPKESLHNDVFAIDSRYLPAECVGGDYYDYIHVDEYHTGLCVADVTGHGVSAAFIMTLVKSCMQLSTHGILSTREVMRQLNEFMCKNVPNNNLVSMLYAIIDIRTRTLRYTSAGHNPSLWYRKSRNSFEWLTTDGLFLCMFDTTEYGEIELQFEPGDIFLFYTDGLTEAKNNRDEMFGVERMQKVIALHSEQSADEISAAIFKELQAFVGKTTLTDDLTYSILKAKQ